MASNRPSLPCIVCKKELFEEFDMPDTHKYTQPAYGVVCSTEGNYGSEVFDPFDGQRLIFNICDNCLLERSQKRFIKTCWPIPSHKYTDHEFCDLSDERDL